MSQNFYPVSEFSKNVSVSNTHHQGICTCKAYQMMTRRKISFFIFELFVARQVHHMNKKEKNMLGSTIFLLNVWHFLGMSPTCLWHFRKCLSCQCSNQQNTTRHFQLRFIWWSTWCCWWRCGYNCASEVLMEMLCWFYSVLECGWVWWSGCSGCSRSIHPCNCFIGCLFGYFAQLFQFLEIFGWLLLFLWLFWCFQQVVP